jgi:hypothetical protein
MLVPRIEASGTIGAMGGINSKFLPKDLEGPGPKNSILEAVKGMQKKISLPKLVQLDDSIRPYLLSLLIASVDALQEKFIIPNTAIFEQATREEFLNHLATLAQGGYDKYGDMAKYGLPPPAPEKGPKKGSREEFMKYFNDTLQNST